MLQTINYQKEIQTKLAKNLLDMLILQMLNRKPMHGYQIITETRKDYGVYFGPSKIYPLLATLEKKGYLNSTWNMTADKPRKIFSITTVGKNTLKFTEDSLNNICKTLKSP
ncbi:MAG: PadR family transcriptional regulator [Nitrososphaerota archaeon]|jgi:DNA-binding PadR family transcriptional regulator|uniref:PadR family transcriptional regulator n=1 Tax=Candidatus Bathycorpusculum sp. TaxID=2994959 RepID=UPI00282DAF07|nr:PadR family transcriptional regulator [Candidatus Termiticorpusculum sp.]MCL2292751.1 PadR family transcriptional regulator [Candidatus Termiticorpusculum sp.]MDR0460641.1 PadR family transcriptional regulator [Nitrososphaerota archaeon]